METNFKRSNISKRKDVPFSDETKELFMFNYKCWKCGKNSWNCGHHIAYKEVYSFSNSPFNYAPLHNEPCHIGGGHQFTDEETINYLKKTYNFLRATSYSMTEKDSEFITMV